MLGLGWGLFSSGYGQIRYKGKSSRTHRVSWELNKGNIPANKCVLHKCDNPKCVRISHLFLGTLKDNSEDMVKKGRAASGDRNGTHTHPEKVPRGDKHGFRLHPEKVPRGKRHGRYTKPERTARGERSGPRLHPERMKRGEEHGRAKLTEVNVLEIRDRRKKGETLQRLAEEFGVTDVAISKIARGETWKHVKM